MNIDDILKRKIAAQSTLRELQSMNAYTTPENLLKIEKQRVEATIELRKAQEDEDKYIKEA